ncbi:MAG: protein kinase domain-containing protein [Actinoallomurus sp.]
MGTVWHAHDDLLARDVAVKEVLFPPGLTEDEHKVMYERTLREARSAARLNHPGIVTVHDVVEADGRPCIVMEFVRARSLQEVIDEEGRLPPIQVAEIGLKVLAALRTAHAAGITHRDVKPANVLLAGAAGEPISRSTRVVITDFGIATMEGDSTLTQTGLIMGSPAYIAPERARGDKASPASDLWSLGATLYAAVEGRSPHHRTDAMAALTSVISEDAPPPRHAGPLAQVLMGLLAKDPAGRLTADQAVEDLTRAAQSTRPLPAPDPAATASADPSPGPERPGGPWRLAVDSAPPYESSSAAVAEPEAGGRGGPAAMRDPAPPGGARLDPSAHTGGGPPGSGATAQDEGWMRTYDRPAEASAASGRSGAGPRAVLVALVAVVAAAGIVLALMINFSGGKDDPSAATRQPSSPTSPSPTKSSTRPPVPAGYRQVRAMDGSTLVVPKGWRHETRRAQSERWIDPNTGSNIQLDTIPWGTPDPVRHWQTWDGPKILPKFQMVEPPHPVEARGWKMADVHYMWLFPWDSTAHPGGRAQDRQMMHVFDRGFTVNGRQYSLMSVARDSPTAKDYFDKAFAAFQPGPP